MTTTAELTPLLKRLKLGRMLDTLPERLALARRDQLDYAAFLQILLADEISRRDSRSLELHLQSAGFEQICRLEDFDWTAAITVNRRTLETVFSLDFLNRHEHVIMAGPVGHRGDQLPPEAVTAPEKGGPQGSFDTPGPEVVQRYHPGGSKIVASDTGGRHQTTLGHTGIGKTELVSEGEEYGRCACPPRRG